MKLKCGIFCAIAISLTVMIVGLMLSMLQEIFVVVVSK